MLVYLLEIYKSDYWKELDIQGKSMLRNIGICYKLMITIVCIL